MNLPAHFLSHAVLFCAILTSHTLRAQDSTHTAGFEFLPESNRFRQLVASWQEPRLGIRKQIGSSRLRLDIGAALEFLGYRLGSGEGIEARAAVEFFAYGLTTSARGHRLQVDALDGHFGGYLAIFVPTEWGTLCGRLRIMHLSSHFADGHLDLEWKPVDDRSPTPFTRDFGELLAAPLFRLGEWELRPYAGVRYFTLVRPDDLARWGGVAGLEVLAGSFPGELLGRSSSLFLATHAALEGNPSLTVSTAVDAGILLGGQEGAGIRLFAGYFNGNDVFHQYYDMRRQYWSLGISFAVR